MDHNSNRDYHRFISRRHGRHIWLVTNAYKKENSAAMLVSLLKRLTK